MKNVTAIILGTILLTAVTACGKVSKGPISPLIDPPVQYSFDTGTQGWTIRESIPINSATLSYSTQRALDSEGSLRADLGFRTAGDKALIGTDLPAAKDMSGKTLSVWIYWDSGLAMGGGKLGAQVYVMDSGNIWANGTFYTLTLGSWTQATFNIDAPNYTDGTDMTDITRVGVQIIADIGNFVPGVVYIDQFGF